MVDYTKVTDNPKIVQLLKAREVIDELIKEIDSDVLLKYELERVSEDSCDTKHTYKEGDKVRVIDRLHGHEFEIGTIVK